MRKACDAMKDAEVGPRASEERSPLLHRATRLMCLPWRSLFAAVRAISVMEAGKVGHQLGVILRPCHERSAQATVQASGWRRSASLVSEAVEATTRQASTAFLQLAEINPESFASALGVEQTVATSQALRHLQAIEAASHTLRELTAELAGADEQQTKTEALTTYSIRMKQRLEVNSGSHKAHAVLATRLFFWI